ncbi:sigma-54 dependent transcriptional regulator [Candidatus Sulfidibacterium hydrothermale]|uniref:sigma-54-dependent transcriptional regulator n=1 Tax=Candidatus Sulfidibacterium hydrothermale TaxID=2875962 RepID=UPI001F0B010D|nr:sigma-54 dependent transcriptional regulator [Candidatus Sulfidibacterium hydrothermale]UBM63496.1 sigma-54 dependent transcriptional regulator [Candidatus Sulfidibacterium hydrothermale]
MPEFSILLIDDEPAQITSIKAFLKRRHYRVFTAGSGVEAMKILNNEMIDLVFTDFRMPDMNGLEVVKAIKAFNPEIPVIVITAFSDTEEAVNVMKEGAFDYLPKPVDLDELEILVRKTQELNYLKSENKLLKEQLKEKYKFDNIISQSSELENILNTVSRVARSKVTVLIRGETGTGKELIAKAIHYASDRSDKPMITVNCAALSEGLLESELFGHEKGAFTGATSQHIGRFEQANGGTLFIDEVGDIPLQTQVKLLRALQFGEFERVGGSKTIKVDVRVITATNRNLEELIKKGAFREDLFYRINVITITLPPLRERKTDIPLLIRYFISRYAKENGKQVEGISKEAQDYLMKYHFPGNIRELENIIERAVVLTRENIITTHDLPRGLSVVSENNLLDPEDFSDPYTEKVAAFETAMIEKALKLKEGNQSRAAQLLGISERHLRSRMQKLNITNPRK